MPAVTIAPGFFLGPLGALLLVSRPRTWREWLWILIAAGGVYAWLQIPPSLVQQTVNGAAAFFTGAFVVVTLIGIRSLLRRAMIALVIATLGVAGWYLGAHLTLHALQADLSEQLWATLSQLLPSPPATMPPSTDLLNDSASPDRAQQLAAMVHFTTTMFPASLALMALLGARLAWAWYHAIARAPLLAAPSRFRDFRFNDQAIWLVIVSVATLLLVSHPGITFAAANTLFVLLALYAVRGAAILRQTLLRASPGFFLILLLIMLPLFGVIPIGLTLLGIADTWVDFRRRLAPPPGATP